MPQIKVNLAQTPQGPPSPGKPLTRAQANQILHQQSKLSFKEVLANLKKTGATPEDLRRIEKKLLGPEGLLMSMTARNPFGLGDDALNLAILQVLLQGTRNQASGIQSFKAFEAYVDRLRKGQSEADDFYKRVRQHAGVLRAGAEGGPQSPTSPISPIGYINPNITQSRGWGPFAAGMVDGVLEVGLASGLSTLGFTSNPLQGLRDLKDSFNQGAAALKFVFSHLPKATQAGAQALVKAVQGIPSMSDYHKGKLLVQAVLLVISAVGAAKAGAKLASVAKEIASGKVRTLGQIKARMQASGNSGLTKPSTPQKRTPIPRKTPQVEQNSARSPEGEKKPPGPPDDNLSPPQTQRGNVDLIDEQDYYNLLSRQLSRGDLNPQILLYYVEGQRPVGDRLWTPMHAAFGSLDAAKQSVTNLIVRAGKTRASALAVDIFEVSHPGGDKQKSYLVSAWPGQLFEVSRQIQIEQKQQVEAWARRNGVGVKLLESRVTKPGVKTIDATKNANQQAFNKYYELWQQYFLKDKASYFPSMQFLATYPLRGNVKPPGKMVRYPGKQHAFFDSVERANQEVARLMAQPGLTGELSILVARVADPGISKKNVYLVSLIAGEENSVRSQLNNINIDIAQWWAQQNQLRLQPIDLAHSHPSGNPLPSGLGRPYSRAPIDPDDPQADALNGMTGDILFNLHYLQRVEHPEDLRNFSIWVRTPSGASQLQASPAQDLNLEQVQDLVDELYKAYARRDGDAIEGTVQNLFTFSLQKYDSTGRPAGPPVAFDPYLVLKTIYSPGNND